MKLNIMLIYTLVIKNGTKNKMINKMINKHNKFRVESTALKV